MRDFRQLCDGNVAVKADDPVVGGMHAHEGDGVLVDGLFVILRVHAVGTAHLAQGRAAALHHVRDAEAASYFHKLAARHHDFASGTQRIHRDQHRRRIVVDHKGGFRAGEGAEQVLHMAVAAAALARGEVQFKVGITPAGVEHRFHRLGGQDGAAHIGMDDHPGRVEHAAETRGALTGGESGQSGEQHFRRKPYRVREAALADGGRQGSG